MPNLRKKTYKGSRPVHRGKKKNPTKTKKIGGFMGNGIATLTINRGLGFPTRFRTKLRYNETIGFTSTAGVYSTYGYSCNGCYKPNQVVSGHQPMYFDQLISIYDHYKVLGSRCRVEFISNAITPITPVFLELYVDDDLTAPLSTIQAIELGNLRKYITLGGANNNSVSAICKSSWSLKKYFKDKYNSADMSGTVAQNPVEQSFYLLGIQSMDGSSTNTIYANVTIDYIVDFYELVTLTGS